MITRRFKRLRGLPMTYSSRRSLRAFHYNQQDFRTALGFYRAFGLVYCQIEKIYKLKRDFRFKRSHRKSMILIKGAIVQVTHIVRHCIYHSDFIKVATLPISCLICEKML
jgi:hypothetical protein